MSHMTLDSGYQVGVDTSLEVVMSAIVDRVAGATIHDPLG